jgi:hypothetical protein
MASQSVSESNFGLLIAYVLPGYTALKGLPFIGSDFSNWSITSPNGEATIAGFLATSIEAIFAGLTVSLLRWFVIDNLHHWSGLKPPNFDFAILEKRSQAFELLVRYHYLYYKCTCLPSDRNQDRLGCAEGVLEVLERFEESLGAGAEDGH